jgi:hypothetical protein
MIKVSTISKKEKEKKRSGGRDGAYKEKQFFWLTTTSRSKEFSSQLSAIKKKTKGILQLTFEGKYLVIHFEGNHNPKIVLSKQAHKLIETVRIFDIILLCCLI